MIVPLLLAGLAGCDNESADNPILPPPSTEPDLQTVECRITAPADGAVIALEEGGFTVTGEASASTGALASVVLTIGGQTVEEVTAVPFTYAYTFAEDQQAGELVVTLTVTGDAEEAPTAAASVTVTLTQEEVEEQVLALAFETPQEGDEWLMDEPLKICATVEVNVGTVEQVTLSVGGVEVYSGAELPAEVLYEAAEDQPEGETVITLAAEGSEGAVAAIEVTVMAVKPEPEPDPEPDNTMTDPRDGKLYRTVTLGTQTWMAENLAWLPAVYPSAAAADSDTEQRYFVLNYEGSDVDEAKASEAYAKSGVLYNWFAANGRTDKTGASAEAVPSGVQGACPDGWHLPSKAEWQLLEAWVSEQLPPVTGQNASYETDNDMRNVWSALAGLEGWGESSMTYENPDLANGPRDTFGFGVIPAGYCWQSGLFGESDANTGFWATDMQSYGGGCVEFSINNYNLRYTKSGYSERRGYSVRCVKD